MRNIFFKFIRKRLDYRKFSGLTLSLILLAFFYIVILSGGVIENVIRLNPIALADTRLANFFALNRSAGLSKIFLWVTMLGKTEIVLGFFIAIAGILWIRGKRRYIFPFFVSIVGSGAFTYLGKIIFHRPRPELPYYIEHGFSFPSGHATLAMAFYGFLTYLLIKNFPGRKARLLSVFFGLMIILLIGFTRLYLGVHYLSDVCGGYLVGGLWLIIGISLSEWTAVIFHQPSGKQAANKKFILSALFVLLAIVLYIGLALHYMP